MEITGRLTVDATVSTVKGDRQVVNFSIAINDSYKPKDADGFREITTYVNCAYWLNSKAAAWLTKGVLVQLYGRIGFNVYNNMDGKAVGSLTFHVNNLKLLAYPKSRNNTDDAATPHVAAPSGDNNPSVDDLPF